MWIGIYENSVWNFVIYIDLVNCFKWYNCNFLGCIRGDVEESVYVIDYVWFSDLDRGFDGG